MTAGFQSAAGEQGRQFTEQCNTLLAGLGYELHGPVRLHEVGVEIDQHATSPNGARVWFEYKGSIQGSRPGLRRTDTLKKAIANGALLAGVDERVPYVVLTSHLPVDGSGLAMMNTALRLGLVDDIICVYDPTQTGRLKTF